VQTSRKVTVGCAGSSTFASLDFARGSARETRGRYERMKHWLDEGAIKQRIALLDEIFGILTASIGTMRKK